LQEEGEWRMSKITQVLMSDEEKLEIIETELPPLQDDEVLVTVKNCGICGSDIHAYLGEQPFMRPPLVLGHEFSGVVDEVGAKVKDFKNGMRVTVEPCLVCHECYNCREGNYNTCEELKVIGCQSIGAFAEKIIVPAERVVPMPDEVDFESGALIEPASVGAHVVKRSGGVAGKNVVVLGSGTIGLLVARVAQISGAKSVIITDVDDFRLDIASKMGLENTVNVRNEDLKERILKEFGKDGADMWFECVGSAETINFAINNARRRTTIVMVGVIPTNQVIENMANIQEWELTIIGCLIYTREDYERAIDMFKSGQLTKDAIITHRFNFKDAPKAFEMIKNKSEKFLKVMLCME
jgi:L-iditol 2-dehydrogenase